jgi:hypothetical protein
VTFLASHTFSVTLADGTAVGSSSGAPSVIPAGTYELFVNDASGAVMQFDLSGPGVDLVTNMTDGEDLSASYVETFLPSSTYSYQDDDQPGLVWSFATGAAAAPPATTIPTPTPPPPAQSGSKGSGGGGAGSSPSLLGPPLVAGRSPLVGSLVGTVSAAGALTLRFEGKEVTTLAAGRYRITVSDASRTRGFILQELDRPAITVTGPAFVGTRTATLALTRGRWVYYPSFTGKKTSFVVS